MRGKGKAAKSFTFDKVYGQESTQEQIYHGSEIKVYQLLDFENINFVMNRRQGESCVACWQGITARFSLTARLGQTFSTVFGANDFSCFSKFKVRRPLPAKIVLFSTKNVWNGTCTVFCTKILIRKDLYHGVQKPNQFFWRRARLAS